MRRKTIGWSRGLRINGKTTGQKKVERSTHVKRATRMDIKVELIKRAGGKCYLCGYNRSLAALQFHHRERGEKTTGVSMLLDRYYVANDGYAKQRLLILLEQEIKKCSLLCANCHVEITHPDWENKEAGHEDKSLRGIRHQMWYRQWLIAQPQEIKITLKRLWSATRFHHTAPESWFMPVKLRELRPDLARAYDEQKYNEAAG